MRSRNGLRVGRRVRASVRAGVRPPAAEQLEARRMLSASAATAAATAFRPPSVPLVASSPYLSVWSDATNLTDDTTREWTGTPQAMVSLVQVDGTTYRLMGDDPSTLAAFPQVGLQVTPTRSIYDFDNGHVHVTLTFMTPALPDNLDVLTRPVTYQTWAVHAVDGKSHNVELYDSVSSALAVTDTSQVVQWYRGPIGDMEALHVGTVAQTYFQPAGDRVGIDWGYAYLAATAGISRGGVTGDAESTAAFVKTGTLPNANDAGTRAVDDDTPVMAFSYGLGSVGSAVVSRHMIVAYDETYAVDYFGEKLVPYWKRGGLTISNVIATADQQYASLVTQCAAFDAGLTADLTTEGGAPYAAVTDLAYRQALASTEIAADRNGQPLLFTKEQSSNGDIATADVIYPTDPVFFLLNPTLAKASLVPLLSFAASPMWTQAYAPHDLGTFPQALGEPSNGEEQPVEESGNMLIMADTIAHEEGSAEFADLYWGDLSKWAAYLQPYAYDPGSQLTTDDFLGTIYQSTNLAIKAIEGLGAYAQLCQLRGDTADYNTYLKLAKADATHLLSVATDGNHLELGYGDTGTWSQDYNLVWDSILGLNLFPTSVAAEEVAYYKTLVQTYGVPVESTTESAKVDWSTWAASLATNKSDFQTLFAGVYNYLNTTTVRTPLSDLYQVNAADSSGFTARSVVGGLFIRMLDDPAMWKKYSSMDTTKLTGWAAFPTETAILPTALTSPQVWKYTTATPAADWTAATFNDTGWASGTGGFGTAGTPGAVVNTTWNTDDIYLRKTIKLPSTSLNNLSVYAYHDEDMQIYVNGVLATGVTGYITGYQLFDISTAAQAQLRPGATVTIAVHCLQTTGGQDIDVGLVNAS